VPPEVDDSSSQSDSSAESPKYRRNAEGVEAWGYVDVRLGAHMFYWLYQSYHPDGYLTRPLILWLQVIGWRDAQSLIALPLITLNLITATAPTTTTHYDYYYYCYHCYLIGRFNSL